MPRFSANLSTMFQEYAPLDRPRAAREAGFSCVEMQFPYDIALDALAAAVGEQDLAVSVLNLPAGDFMNGGPGLAAVPGREQAFDEAIATALPYARALGAPCVNVLAGAPAPEDGREACLRTLGRNLGRAADAFARIGVRVVVEAVNDRDRPGFLLPRTADAAAAIGRAGHANLALQFDFYHVARMGDDPVATFASHRDLVGHVQFSDAPGRHEPGSGTLDFASAFAAIDASGYRGWVAAEYFPTGRTEDSLGWMARP